MDDLKLLQRNGLIELRYIEPSEFSAHHDRLNRFEVEWSGYVTTPYHTLEPLSASFTDSSTIPDPLHVAGGVQA
jgi:hypothetical protein